MLWECFAFMGGHEGLLGGVVGGREERRAVEAALAAGVIHKKTFT